MLSDHRARQPHHLMPRGAGCCSVSLYGALHVDARSGFDLQSRHIARRADIDQSDAPLLTGAMNVSGAPRRASPNDSAAISS